MSLDIAREFHSKVNSNMDLQSEIRGCRKIEETLEVARNHGYHLTSQDLLAVAEEATKSGDLSDFDLELVSGGSPICCVNCTGPSV